jgi:hypothetical protein
LTAAAIVVSTLGVRGVCAGRSVAFDEKDSRYTVNHAQGCRAVTHDELDLDQVGPGVVAPFFEPSIVGIFEEAPF